MELSTIISIISGVTVPAIGLLFRAYHIITKRLDAMGLKLENKPDLEEIRILIADKLEPSKVEFDAVSRRISELKVDQQELGKKIDKLLELCTRLVR